MLTTASCGMPIGYSAILLPQLQFTNSSMHIDEETGSWIGESLILIILQHLTVTLWLYKIVTLLMIRKGLYDIFNARD